MENTYPGSRVVLVSLASFAIVALTAVVAAADTISLGWNPNPESTVIGYMVHVGTQSGTYTQHLDVGSSTAYAWTSAVAGQRYCFAVSAYIAPHTEGTMSGEVCGYSNAPPTLVNPGARSSVQGQSTSLQLQGSDPEGQPVSYTASGMPPGLSVMVGTGFISGTPTTTGTFNVTATVSDGVLTASQTFAWTITTVTSGGDASAPTVTITAPTSATTFTTTTPSLTVSGTASDNVGVTQVTWTNSRGGGGAATGTSSWSAGMTLVDGSNIITVTARDAAGNTASDVLTVTLNTTTSSGGVVGGGTGLRGEYYQGTAFQSLLTTRIDPTVGFSWGSGSPGAGIPVDNFSVRWTGEVLAPVTGTYNFSTVSDDGVRLWVNNQLVVNNWTEHPDTTNTSAGIAMVAGQRYAIRLEYMEIAGLATARLQWAYPGQATQTIPQTALYPTVAVSTGSAGLHGDYYSGNFGPLLMSRVDPTVNFSWGSGSPGAGVPVDSFSVRWTGQVTAPVTGTYTFSTVSDDGVRLWVNNQLVISNWTEHADTTNTSAGITLQAGQRYTIQLEYYEGWGLATMQLRWTVPGQTTQVIPSSALTTP